MTATAASGPNEEPQGSAAASSSAPAGLIGTTGHAAATSEPDFSEPGPSSGASNATAVPAADEGALLKVDMSRLLSMLQGKRRCVAVLCTIQQSTSTVVWRHWLINTYMQDFFQGMRDVDRENEVHRILGAFKLNPFEQLGLRFDAAVEDVKKAYRKSSLMVHPDKCKHPKAQDAFEILGQAQQQLNNEEKMKELLYVLTLAQGII